MKIFRYAILLILSVSVSLRAQTIEQKVKEFDTYIEKSRMAWQMPGMAVVLVKDGKVILQKGYGVRKLGANDLVDDQTLFVCASTTKAMTAACMGILVDQGKVKWDDPVIQHLPSFQLYDPYVTRELKIRDLFTHNSGVGNTDFLWGSMNIPSTEVLDKMKLVKPSYSMRSGFIYQNIFYLAAGQVIEKVSGLTWEKFIKQNIFDKLGMSRTFPVLRDVKDVNQTAPHYLIENSIHVIQHTSADEIGPAGSVWSCASDIGKWVTCMLDSSKYNGGKLLSVKTWNEMFKPQVIVPANEFYPTAQLTKPNWTTYGLGWFQHDYKGKRINFHTGSLAGAIAIHAQLPESKLGIYVFGNYDHAELRHALVYKAFDLFALGGTRDWSTEFQELYKKITDKNEKTEKDFEAKRVAGTKPSLDLNDYAGKYTDPLFGQVEITVNENSLVVNMNNFVKAKLDHWNYDTFRGWYDKHWYGKANAVFSLDASGKIIKLNFDGAEFTKEKQK
ncbi:serine hydrolase [Cytophagales bacterium WSM2-2]|nr:serine hydrolase [Cytophagales bacterium WSM2-2]